MPTYNFAVRISDFTDSQIFNLLGEAGEVIVGMPAAELFKVNEDYSKVNEICRNQCFQSLQLLVKVRNEENQFGEKTIKYVIVRA